MHADNWANKAKQEGYRTRAVYKLDEIIQKTKVLKNFHGDSSGVRGAAWLWNNV